MSLLLNMRLEWQAMAELWGWRCVWGMETRKCLWKRRVPVVHLVGGGGDISSPHLSALQWCEVCLFLSLCGYCYFPMWLRHCEGKSQISGFLSFLFLFFLSFSFFHLQNTSAQ
jgi:hypothetical protein